ncbi:hypothetical protein [Sphingomonas pseudosanguinis]|uniref:Preprotein translocase subunit YajC n=1 Tax=Sphingomonas pseudosanguinis TaxID=413712 RepID=A0A7W6A9Y3_9SPHN|nr:hypothetical protein [Sphingomonas pseudosanguinis]MBB3879934.1 hypothetical protein [Sphingomonas pseudosanguinis]MBN3537407.1 hypothetical protein [Sphingomonas pseudosanguinis]
MVARPILTGCLGLAMLPAAAFAQTQDLPPPSGVAPGAGNAPPAGSAPAPAADGPDRPRARVSPYIEVGQLFSADLNGGDSVTFTTLAAGVNAQVDTARAQGQVSYRYEHRIAWNDGYGGGDVHSGLARGLYRITPELSIDGGALATRTRSDIRGAAPGVLVGNPGNISQLYSAYVGPVLRTRAGPVQLLANYRLGYTRAETPGLGGLASNQPRLDYFSDSWNHMATVNASTRPGTILPVGLSASGLYERDDARQLAQRYEGWFARGDVLYPVSPYVALTAGVGYERIESSQRDAAVDAAGRPLVDSSGRFVIAPDSPRRIAYRTDGVYYDAGVIWRPNRRTSVEGHIGERYGSLSITGTAQYEAARGVFFRASVYDGIQTFGRQMRNGLSGLPTQFVETRDAFSQQFNGCVFSTSGATPGGCLNDVLQSVQTAVYRARGVDATLTMARGRSTLGFGLGYSNRRLFAPDAAPGLIVGGADDESWYAQIFFGRSLSRDSGLNVNGFVNYYASRLAGAEDVVSVGTTASYFHNFGRLGTTASVGLYHFSVGDLTNALSAQALIAARYQF